MSLDGGDDRRDEVAAIFRRPRHALECRLPRRRAAAGPYGSYALDLALLHVRIDVEQRHASSLGFGKSVHAHDDRFAGVDRQLRAVVAYVRSLGPGAATASPSNG